MWAKRYLALGNVRPTWAFVADWLIRESIPTSKNAIHDELTMNMFLQTWSPAMHTATKLPKCLQTMMKTAKKYNINMEAIHVLEKAKSTNASVVSHWNQNTQERSERKEMVFFIKKIHKPKTVEDLMAITQRLRDGDGYHRHSKIATCTARAIN